MTFSRFWLLARGSRCLDRHSGRQSSSVPRLSVTWLKKWDSRKLLVHLTCSSGQRDRYAQHHPHGPGENRDADSSQDSEAATPRNAARVLSKLAVQDNQLECRASDSWLRVQKPPGWGAPKCGAAPRWVHHRQLGTSPSRKSRFSAVWAGTPVTATHQPQRRYFLENI